MSDIWPIVLIVASNILYQICAKSVPKDMDVMASMTVTYLVGAVCSGLMFFAMNRTPHLLQECSKLNAAPILLGISVVGLELYLCLQGRLAGQHRLHSAKRIPGCGPHFRRSASIQRNDHSPKSHRRHNLSGRTLSHQPISCLSSCMPDSSQFKEGVDTMPSKADSDKIAKNAPTRFQCKEHST